MRLIAPFQIDQQIVNHIETLATMITIVQNVDLLLLEAVVEMTATFMKDLLKTEDEDVLLQLVTILISLEVLLANLNFPITLKEADSLHLLNDTMTTLLLYLKITSTIDVLFEKMAQVVIDMILLFLEVDMNLVFQEEPMMLHVEVAIVTLERTTMVVVETPHIVTLMDLVILL